MKSIVNRTTILVVSLVLPLAVAALYFLPKSNDLIEEIKILPALNASINGITSLVLIMAVWAIKNSKRILHERLMFSALGLSVLFLLSYVAYHSLAPSTKFGGEGMISYIYYFILITHIILAMVIVPLVLITFSRALSEKFDKHKKIAKITFPLWLYVTITGVIVYFMISPYY